jgi:alpha-tubulin suppressor-like RCC1 family protein
LFWQLKFRNDYGQINYSGSWKELYQNYNNVWSFGTNSSGQLGLGDHIDRYVPTQIPNFKARQVSTANDSTVVIDLENNVWAFGSNTYRQLGLGGLLLVDKPMQILNMKAKQVASRVLRARETSTGGNHTVLLDMENNVWIFCSNGNGQLDLGDSIKKDIPTQIPNVKAKQVASRVLRTRETSAGGFHTVMIDLENNVSAFGLNLDGQLGLGHYKDRNTPTQIPNIKAKQVASRVLRPRETSAGNIYTAIIDLENNVWIFGSNLDLVILNGEIDQHRFHISKLNKFLLVDTIQ